MPKQDKAKTVADTLESDTVFSFVTKLEKFNSNLWTFHFAVPLEISDHFASSTGRRVVCKLQEKIEFQCALMPQGNGGGYFINLNKKNRDTLRLELGAAIQVQMWADKSEYGLPMPEELAALFELDDEASALFHALTAGKQRTLLHIIGSVKSSDIRIHRALAITEHLRSNHGKVNYKTLNIMFKEK